MGCSQSNIVEKKPEPEEEKQQAQKMPTIPFYETITNSETLFKDMPETKNGKYIGTGIKRIPNYICHLPCDKLEELREQFWASRNQTDLIWLILKKCCEVDGAEAEKLLEANNQVCIESDLRHTYSRFQPNFIYHIPNYCINDPFYQKDFDGYEKLYDTVDDRNIKININYYNEGKEYQMKIRNKCTGFDLKHKFSKMINLDTRNNNMKLLYKGQEIEDTHCMYYHNLVEDSHVYILSTPKNVGNNSINNGNTRLKKRSTKRSSHLVNEATIETSQAGGNN